MIQTYKCWITIGILVAITSGYGQDSTSIPDSLTRPDSLLMQTVQSIYDPTWVTQALVIESGEDAAIRWISISHAQTAENSYLHHPIMEANGNTGSFSIQLGGIDTNAYLGSQMLRDHGNYPIHYQVEFPDSQAIKIAGKTLPYDDINYYYSFTDSHYRFEFIFKDQAVHISSTSADNISPKDIQSIPSPSGESAALNWDILKNKGSELKSMFVNAVYLGAAALGLTLLIFAFIVWFKRRKDHKDIPEKNFSDMLDTKVTDPDDQNISSHDEPIILTPEEREEKVRKLMETDKLSYDEAALRIQYEQMNQ